MSERFEDLVLQHGYSDLGFTHRIWMKHTASMVIRTSTVREA
jgi:hypothetical protein